LSIIVIFFINYYIINLFCNFFRFHEIAGEEGNDELDGGPVNDMLTGSVGADIFKCDQSDEILDFDSSEGDIKIGSCSVDGE
jgi:hypothetical protein